MTTTKYLHLLRYAGEKDVTALLHKIAIDTQCSPDLIIDILDAILKQLVAVLTGVVSISLGDATHKSQTHKSRAPDLSTLQFSPDYRQVKWQDNLYSFTKKQSVIMETLVRAGGIAHKDLLCAEAQTNQPISHIFRGRQKGKMVAHPLWGILIKNDCNGRYFLQV